MKKLLFLLAIVLSTITFAQNSLTGKILGKDNLPIPDVQVLLINASNEETLKVVITDKEGKFEIENVKFDEAKIVIEQSDYEKYTSDLIKPSEANINLPDINLKSGTKSIEAVTIVAKKPFVTQKIDRVVINPDALISNAGTTALDVLGKSPSVNVDFNDNVSLRGKSGVQIFIDDKPTYLAGSDLADYLRSIPSSNIESIEVIPNPPAKYDASGNAGIINIRLKKTLAKGFNGGFNLAYGQGKYMRSVNSANFNYRIQKWNFFTNLSVNKTRSYQDLTIKREYFTPEGERTSIFTQNSYITPTNRTNSMKIGADFYANDKTTFGIVLNGFINPSERNTMNNAVIQDNNLQTINKIEANIPMDVMFKNGSVNLNMTRKIKDKQELSINADYIKYDSKIEQSQFNKTLNPDNSVFADTRIDSKLPSDVTIKVLKADYSGINLFGGSFDLGAKSSFVKTGNVADFRDVKDGIETPNYTFSNNFDYKENIHAVYTNYAKEFDKISIQLGLRMEYSDIKGYQKGNPVVKDSAFTKRYASLFPTFFIQYRADSLQNHVVGLSLGRRIDRPNYKDMNPFTYPMDNYTFYGGNPFLEPTFSYNADLNYTFKKNYTLGFNYSYIDNLISETNEQRNGIYYSRPGNFDRQISYGFTFNSSTNITKWWTFQLYTELIHNAFKSDVYTEKLNDSKWNWFVMPTNQFTISKKWSAELAGQYQTSILSGQFLISPIGSIRAGISTKILKDQGTLKLNVSDMFYTNQVEGEIRNIQNAKAGWFSYMDSRVVTLSFSYRFSKGNTLKIRQSGGSETEQSRVKI
ncbi:TonB-dependent receptor [Epilithonimonas xixisoli]|uniref:Outer membrane receptor protein involved in Fe transport n=1 Tax=Epilithonimonas xixisoli TaxID=1476462 RepID=A0A4R8ID45_9FLAO|nr:TonB-dependent receptor [Epilithonimonas xixisoli]TDX82675.1 outer membrane receptor protein involved in Fe transport [Epilithonimonas xixisoli]